MIKSMSAMIFVALFSLSSSWAFAGGSMGGGGPGLQLEDSLALMRVAVGDLPKAYAEADDLRRATGRLSVAGTETTDLNVDGETIKVRKLRDSVVDEKVSKEILSQ